MKKLLILVAVVIPFGVSAATLDIGAGAGSTGIEAGAMLSSDIDIAASSTTDTPEDTQSAEHTQLFKVNAEGVPVRSSAQVASDADLEAFSYNLMIEDSNVSDIETSDETVEVKYRHHGKLFGLFPVVVQSRTEVRSGEDGSVEVATSLPWWSVFVTGTGGLASSLKSRIAESASVTTGARAQTYAEIAEQVVLALDAQVEVQ